MRYTISRHVTLNGNHYDLFLETENDLETYRLSGPPELGEVRAEKIDSHRKDYLDYQGPISGDRGEVRIYSQGQYRRDGDRLLLQDGKSAGDYLFCGETLVELLLVKVPRKITGNPSTKES